MDTTKMLTVADILKTQDIVYQTVAIPEWGGSVVVRSMTSTEKDEYEEKSLHETKTIKRGKVKTERKVRLSEMRARLVAASCCKGVGDPTLIFSPSDVAALGKKCGKPIERIVEVAQQLSGFTDTDIDDIVGN